MSVITIRPGGLVVKDPSDVLAYMFDWDAENLGVGVTIASSSFTITPVGPSTTDTALTKDDTSSGLGIQAGSRTVKVKLSAGTLGQTYDVANKIVTNENPAQTIERAFRLLVQDL